MTNLPIRCASILPGSLQRSILALVTFFALAVIVLPLAQAQTFNVIYNFSGGLDGATPYAGLTIDHAGNFYGTTFSGGSKNLGTVYRLKHSGSGWLADGLHSFTGGASDGAEPLARAIFGPDGSLYGTTSIGGRGQSCALGCGVVFQLRPPVTFCRSASCPWTETLLYQFGGIPDGGFPSGEMVFDESRNLYGTANIGGRCCGVIYELTGSGNDWTESIVHSFSNSEGALPFGGVIIDNTGNLYGTTQEGGPYARGTVFEFAHSGSGWQGNLLYIFQGMTDGGLPNAGLIFDNSGNIFGAASAEGSGGGGTVFELSPSGGGWTYSVLYSFTGSRNYLCPNPGNLDTGAGPWATLAMDPAGNLYGTTLCDGTNRLGNIFRLTPSGGSWTYTSLHDFTGSDDGAYPLSSVIVESGNLYGTASAGGSKGHGVVWEITP